VTSATPTVRGVGAVDHAIHTTNPKLYHARHAHHRISKFPNLFPYTPKEAPERFPTVACAASLATLGSTTTSWHGAVFLE
jgi:hypothetical protein